MENLESIGASVVDIEKRMSPERNGRIDVGEINSAPPGITSPALITVVLLGYIAYRLRA